MKVLEILIEQEEFEADEDPTRKRLTDQELEFAYNLVKDGEKTKDEIQNLSIEHEVDFSRTKGSLKFVLRRLHILVHGIIPLEDVYQPGWFSVPKTMEKWAEHKGIDYYQQLKNAEAEAKARPVKIDRTSAVSVMSEYYRNNKNQLPPLDQIKKYREQIIKSIMNGTSAAEAFDTAFDQYSNS